MNTISGLKACRGFALLGIAVGLAILVACAAVLVSLVATNDQTKTREHYLDQGYYVSHAALEYSLRNLRALSATPPAREFLGTSLGITVGAKIASVTSYGQSTNRFSITAPSIGPPACIYVLGSTASQTLLMTGAPTLNSPSCGIYMNSSSSTALSGQGSSVINSSFVSIAGNFQITGGSSITTKNGTVTPYNGATGIVTTGATAVPDPLAAYNMPTYASCTYTNANYASGTVTINPGVYCNGLNVNNSAQVTMNPGNYIIDGGQFNVAGSTTVTGSGVTIFLNKQLQSSYATLNLNNGGTITISAPTSGTYAGIAVFQNRNATSSGSNIVTGAGALNITGAIYVPNQNLNFSGGATSNSPCTLLIASSLTMTGSANISCSAGALSGLIN